MVYAIEIFLLNTILIFSPETLDPQLHKQNRPPARASGGDPPPSRRVSSSRAQGGDSVCGVMLVVACLLFSFFLHPSWVMTARGHHCSVAVELGGWVASRFFDVSSALFDQPVFVLYIFRPEFQGWIHIAISVRARLSSSGTAQICKIPAISCGHGSHFHFYKIACDWMSPRI